MTGFYLRKKKSVHKVTWMNWAVWFPLLVLQAYKCNSQMCLWCRGIVHLSFQYDGKNLSIPQLTKETLSPESFPCIQSSTVIFRSSIMSFWLIASAVLHRVLSLCASDTRPLESRSHSGLLAWRDQHCACPQWADMLERCSVNTWRVEWCLQI